MLTSQVSISWRQTGGRSGVMEGEGGEREALRWAPAGPLMKWSDFLVCFSQLLPLQSQDMALALCPARATIPPNPLSEHVNIKAKHLPSRSLQLFGNANIPPSGSLLYSLMLAKHQNVMKTEMVEHNILYYSVYCLSPAHSIRQHLWF